jgi:hypothetical protein
MATSSLVKGSKWVLEVFGNLGYSRLGVGSIYMWDLGNEFRGERNIGRKRLLREIS